MMTPVTKSKIARDVVLVAAASAATYYKKRSDRRCDRRFQSRGSRWGSRTRIRTRRSVNEVFEILGPSYFRRALRMTYSSFKKLELKLEGYIVAASKKYPTRSRHIINGPIYPAVRLACALRYFAGGSPLDIMGLFSVGHTDVLDSVWFIVDAINTHPEFKLQYPDSRQIQNQLQQDSEPSLEQILIAVPAH
jgi:hypothetical protein